MQCELLLLLLLHVLNVLHVLHEKCEIMTIARR